MNDGLMRCADRSEIKSSFGKFDVPVVSCRHTADRHQNCHEEKKEMFHFCLERNINVS